MALCLSHRYDPRSMDKGVTAKTVAQLSKTSLAAYVLVQALRRTALAGTELARAQVRTIRLKLFKVAAVVNLIANTTTFIFWLNALLG